VIWQQQVLIAWFVLNLVLYVALIGKQLSFTAHSALCALVIYPVLIWLVVSL
jgi:hypothetical protein